MELNLTLVGDDLKSSSASCVPYYSLLLFTMDSGLVSSIENLENLEILDRSDSIEPMEKFRIGGIFVLTFLLIPWSKLSAFRFRMGISAGRLCDDFEDCLLR